MNAMQKRLRGSVKAAVNRFRFHMPRVKQSAKVRTNMTISQKAAKNRCRAEPQESDADEDRAEKPANASGTLLR